MSPDLAQALASLTTGIYVLTVRTGDQRHGMSSSWVTQVSGDPPLIVAAVDRRHSTYAALEHTGWFALNVVGQKSRSLEDYFYSAAARRPDNLDAIPWEDSPNGLPLLAEAMVNLECQVRDRVATGDHTLFVASVERVTWRAQDTPVTSLDLEYVYVGEVIQRLLR
jgi:flavin reductase